MTVSAGERFHVLREGAVREENRSWSEIEDMCRSGLLTANSRIFMPDANEWRPLSETELAELVRVVPETEEVVDPTEELEQEYRDALSEIHDHPGEWKPVVQAAELAAALGNPEKACEHYQEALRKHPYHPRIVQSANKHLSPQQRKTLRYSAKADPAWENLESLVKFPIAGNLIVTAAVAVAVGLLSVWSVTTPVAVLVLVAWALLNVQATGRGEMTPVVWQPIVENPLRSLLRPLTIAAMWGTAIYLPFLLVASAVARGDAEATAFTVIAESPIQIVFMAIISLVVWPIGMIVATFDGAAFKRVLNPMPILKVLVKMELEYVVAVAFVVLGFVVWALISSGINALPVAGKLISAVIGAYLLLCATLVLGRLQARFREELSDGFGS